MVRKDPFDISLQFDSMRLDSMTENEIVKVGRVLRFALSNVIFSSFISFTRYHKPGIFATQRDFDELLFYLPKRREEIKLHHLEQHYIYYNETNNPATTLNTLVSTTVSRYVNFGTFNFTYF